MDRTTLERESHPEYVILSALAGQPVYRCPICGRQYGESHYYLEGPAPGSGYWRECPHCLEKVPKERC